MAQTIIVSNRLPVSVKKTKNGLEFYPSDGGLAKGLSAYANKKNSLWIGWPGIMADELTDDDRQTITKQLRTYHCAPVFLTKKQIDRFYTGYSNSLLWPFLHTLPDDQTDEAKLWRTYREVNELFCETTLMLSKPGGSIWVHDYQLMLVPEMLRDERPNERIGFFLHIPFPKASHYASLRRGRELTKGLLGADLVGFHTKSYADNFLDACAELGIGTPAQGGLALKNRVVRATEFPIGIDYNKFALSGRTAGVQRETRRLTRKYKNQKVILTVDRLDPTKGFMERLKAYRTFLRRHPEQCKNVQLVMIAVPSRGDVAAYKRLRTNVENLVAEINAEFGTRGWQPIEYRHESISFEELAALCRIADVGFVAPLRDGMNLVAKEFVASQFGKKGILILSETAGAAEELSDALLVNPTKPRTLVNALDKALTMPKSEISERLKTMQGTLAANTINDWAGSFMRNLNRASATSRPRTFTQAHLKQLGLAYSTATARLVILDYDGVLAPFKAKPEDAKPTPKLRSLLRDLADKPNTVVAIVSGRSRQDLEQWLGDLPLVLSAEHGAVFRWPGQAWKTLVAASEHWKAILQPALERFTLRTPGTFVEEKNFSLVWHYRNAKPYAAQKAIAAMKQNLRPALNSYGLKIYRGNKIIEIKSPLVNKGTAVKELLTKPYEIFVVMGDDYTDEHMFKAVPPTAYTFKVGPGKTAAKYRLRNVTEVQELLAYL